LLLLLGLLAGPLHAAGLPPIPAPDHLYTTWQGPMEPDKAASVWLLKRHLDPQARFRFFPRGARILEGTTFEVPFARLDRAPGKSLFETLLARLPDPEPALLEMARILNDIELNLWGHRVTQESAGVHLLSRGLATGARDDDDSLARALLFGDALHAGLKERTR
jgi:hypothetical protein